MKKISASLVSQYRSLLNKNGVAPSHQPHYLKWLRYYLDFCEKYKFEPSNPKSLPNFIRKLKEKRQNEKLREQAQAAIRLYYGLSQSAPGDSQGEWTLGPEQRRRIREPLSPNNQPEPNHLQRPDLAGLRSTPRTNANANGKDTWGAAVKALGDEIRVRHYSPKTLKSYSVWARKLKNFTKNRDPAELSTDDVKAFLTFLAVDKKVSASSQNQAFNALLFFFRHVLGREFGKIDGIVRAKRKPYIPVVLSRQEIDAIIQGLTYPYTLVVQLLYGCGLRLFECLNLRTQNFNFDHQIVTVHDGKGKKDRTVPLPQVLIPDLKAHLQRVRNLHDKDLASGYDGVFLFDAIERKYKNAAREFVWQWFFPAKTLTLVPETGEYRRYHLHESHVQKAIKRAVNKAKICKRATAHTFRHSYASHLLQANYDIRTIQELLGHSDVRTTMIYTHTIKSQTKKDAKSPLDFTSGFRRDR